jgi:hypothetical protein
MNTDGRGQLAFGLAGACFVAVTQILGVGCLDRPLNWAIWVFSLAIPVLVFYGLRPPQITPIAEGQELNSSEARALVWYLRALFLGLCGLSLMFFHFGVVAGVLFSLLFVWCAFKWISAHAHEPLSLLRFFGIIFLYPLVGEL